MSLANILFQVICVNWLYEPRDFFNVILYTKTIIDPDYFFSSRLFLRKTPKHQITRRNVITRRNSKEISWCLNTKVTKITKWPNGIHNFKRNVMMLKHQNDQSYQMTQWNFFPWYCKIFDFKCEWPSDQEKPKLLQWPTINSVIFIS